MYREIGKAVLRDWRVEDAPAIVKYGNNRKVWANLRDGFPHPYRLGDAEAFVDRVNAAEPRTVFAIATETEAIGAIGLMIGADVHRYTAEMGYWLGEPFWGRGIMTRAVRSLTEWAFDTLGLHRISAEPYATNPGSHRVLEKAGFACEGRRRCSAFKNGKVVDQLIYSCLPGDRLRCGDEDRFESK